MCRQDTSKTTGSQQSNLQQPALAVNSMFSAGGGDRRIEMIEGFRKRVIQRLVGTVCAAIII